MSPRAAARALLPALCGCAGARAPLSLPFPVIDTHTHFGDPSVLHYSGNWTTELHLPSNYSQDTSSSVLPSAEVVFMEASTVPEENVDEAAWVQSLAAKAKPGIGAICAFIPLEKGYNATVDAIKRIRKRAPLFRGVRRLLDPQPGDADPCWFLNAKDYDFQGGLRALAEHGVHFELLPRVPEQYACVPELVAKAPSGLTIVMQHLGNPNMSAPALRANWSAMVTALAASPNVVAKVSGVPERAAATFDAWTRAQVEPYITHVLDAFGFARSVYGGNWFVVTRFSTYARWASVLLDIVTDYGASPADLRALFRDNARKVYRIA